MLIAQVDNSSKLTSNDNRRTKTKNNVLLFNCIESTLSLDLEFENNNILDYIGIPDKEYLSILRRVSNYQWYQYACLQVFIRNIHKVMFYM